MPESIKNIIEKFVLDQCSEEEIQQLITYFQQEEINDIFPRVEEVLEQLREKQPQMTEEDSKRLYHQILKKAEKKDRLQNKKGKHFFWAMAAVFVGAIGTLFYFGLLRPSIDQKDTVHSVTISALPDVGIRLITDDGDTRSLNAQGKHNVTDKKGNVIGAQEDNTLIYYKGKKEPKDNEIKYNTLKVSYGHRFELKLADGTQVVMNAGSSLKYPVDFPEEGNREVYLTGEAFFDVSKDLNHPFIVNTDKFKVEVLGTQFNVSAYQDESSHDIVLVEGSVNLSSSKDFKHTTHLKPGQLAEIKDAENSFSIREVNTAIYTAWIKGGLVFRNISFESMLQKMSRHYNVTIVNRDRAMAAERFNANFGEESLETILLYYKEIYGLNYIQKQDTIIIQPKTETTMK